MGLPGSCTPDDNDKNFKIAYDLDQEYIGVDNVIVRDRDPATGQITISARTTSGADEKFKIKWNDLKACWPFCPSSLPSEAQYPNAGALPAVGATGRLYIEYQFVRANNILDGTPKWPKGTPEGPLKGIVTLAPVSLVLTAVRIDEDGEPIQSWVDLMDRRHAPIQDIRVGEGEMNVVLTQVGALRFGAHFPPRGDLKSALSTIQTSKRPDELAQAWAVVAEFHRWAASFEGHPPPQESALAGALAKVKGLLDGILAGK